MGKNKQENIQHSWYYHLACSVVIMFLAAVVFLIVVKLFDLKEISINTEMVSFIGILATFVVINNYAQMKELENKINQQQNQIKLQYRFLEKASKVFIDSENKLLKLAKTIYNNPNVKHTIYLIGKKEDNCTIIYDRDNNDIIVKNNHGQTIDNTNILGVDDKIFYYYPKLKRYLIFFTELDNLKDYIAED